MENKNKEIHAPWYALVFSMIAITAFIMFAFSSPLETSAEQSYKTENKQEK